MDLHYDKMCRTCMCREESSTFISIYEVSSENLAMPIIELLTTATPQLLIQPTDELPKTICDRCLCKLTEVHQFQQMCLHSDNHMRGQLENGVEEAKLAQVHETSSTPAVLEIPTSTYDGPDPLQGDDGNIIAEVHNHLKLELNDKQELSTDAIDKNVEMEIKGLEYVDTKFALSDAGSSNESDDSDWKTNRNKKSKIDQTTNSNTIQNEDDTIVSDNNKKRRRNLKKVPCPDCGKKFKSMFHAKRHMGVHDVSKRAYPCLQCKYRFATAASLQRHVSKEHCSEKQSEPTAGSSSNSEDYRDDQEVSIKTQKKAKCQDPTETAPTTCDSCGKILTSKRMMAHHKRMHKKEEASLAKPYKCKFCRKAFEHTYTLEEHVRTHTGEHPYLCSECGKVFKFASNLQQHMIRHAGVMRYQCPDCPKKFPCLSDLGSHKAVHKKWKPHICDVCGAAFGKPCQLKKHKMYHTGEKPHKCEYCEMRFVCADHMRRHTRTHTGEKPYKCKYCDRAFGQSKDMTIHLRIHLGKNIYKCELCPRAFLKATEMREHFATHKNDDEQTRQQNLDALMEEETKLRSTLPGDCVSRKKQENQSNGLYA